MAAPRVFVTMTIEDAKGNSSNFIHNFPTAVDIAILKGHARSFATIVDALVRGRITQVGIGIGVENLPVGLKAAPLPNADVEEGARFTFRTALGTLTSFRVPTFDEAFIVDGTKQVDSADPAVAALVNRMISGDTQGLINVSPSDERGEDVTALESAVESFQSSRTG
jgi:hypothetical protein